MSIATVPPGSSETSHRPLGSANLKIRVARFGFFFAYCNRPARFERDVAPPARRHQSKNPLNTIRVFCVYRTLITALTTAARTVKEIPVGKKRITRDIALKALLAKTKHPQSCSPVCNSLLTSVLVYHQIPISNTACAIIENVT